MNNNADTAAGREILRRREAAGMSKTQLAELAGVTRGAIASIEEGKPARRATVDAILAALDRFEQETSGPYDQRQTIGTVELPNGMRVTYTGSVEDVETLVERFLSRRSD